MDVTLKIDTTDFKHSLQRFALYSKKDGATVLCDATRSFLRRAIALTPPSNGKSDSESRKRGEMAIDRDLQSVFVAKPRSELETLIDIFGKEHVRRALTKKDGTVWLVDYDIIELNESAMEPFHKAKRLAEGHGRVSQAGRRSQDIGRWKADNYMWVPKENLESYKRKLYKRVGALAAGWNPAALSPKIGLRVPAWIRRHGDKYGAIWIRLDTGNMSIVVVNNYHGSVRGLQSQINQALAWTGRDLDRRVDYYLAKSARSAGFH